MQPILFLKILIIHLSLNWFSHDLTSFYFKFFPSTASKLKLDLSILAPPDTVVPSSTEFFIRSAGLLVGPVDISSFFFSLVGVQSWTRLSPTYTSSGRGNRLIKFTTSVRRWRNADKKKGIETYHVRAQSTRDPPQDKAKSIVQPCENRWKQEKKSKNRYKSLKKKAKATTKPKNRSEREREHFARFLFV